MNHDKKKAIESLSKESNKQLKRLLADSVSKQDIKEAIDLWHAYKHKKLEPIGRLGGT